ncbi:siderophore ABC transporter substrate-binding protein [Janibacter indicus]|uniref:Iron complex transport system substrate-binding protein n=1 Tax=Janibacter indicus TaxID=857417 RepID=A0A1W1YK54_9MICO|nr:ABC transporter substrate-binding protein [Janibacter indicus]SMC36502.1 iron complex transport system substrate-binding protein [Janibacter indicus]
MLSRTRSLALASGLALALSACGGSSDSDSASGPTVAVEDNNGTQQVPQEPSSVVATDNRTFETLADWDVELSAAAVSLMPETISYTKDKDLVDLGTHREPDLEAIVAAKPDLVINGQRFTQHEDKLKELAPDAAFLNLDPREGEPLDTELKRQTEVLGEVFGKQDEAKTLGEDLDAQVARVKQAYEPGDTVMAINTSGGELGYIAPTVGQTFGPVFDLFDLEPALEVEGASDDHQGDEVSVEAIAKADPDWILVLDRDAAVAADEEGYTPAKQLIEDSEALQDVTAVKEGQVVFAPADTYTNEGIQTYTEIFSAFADALEEQS